MSILGNNRTFTALSGPPIRGPGDIASRASEIIGANFDVFRISGASDSYSREVAPQLIGSLSRLFQLFPEQEQLNPYHPGVAQGDPGSDRSAVRYSDDQLEKLYRNPDTEALIRTLGRPEIAPYADILEETRARVVAAQDHRAEVGARAHSPVVGAASALAGTGAGFFTDPLALATMPLALATGAPLVQVMMAEGLLNGALEGVVELKSRDFNEKLGLEPEDSNILANMAVAAAGGALFAGAIRGAPRALRRLYDVLDAKKLVPRRVSSRARAELRVIEDSQGVVESLADEIVAVDSPARAEVTQIHAATLDDATAAVSAGRVDDVPSLADKLTEREEAINQQLADLLGLEEPGPALRPVSRPASSPTGRAAKPAAGKNLTLDPLETPSSRPTGRAARQSAEDNLPEGVVMFEDFVRQRDARLSVEIRKADAALERGKGMTLRSVVAREGKLDLANVKADHGDAVISQNSMSGIVSKDSKVSLDEMAERLSDLGEVPKGTTGDELFELLVDNAKSAKHAEAVGARDEIIAAALEGDLDIKARLAASKDPTGKLTGVDEATGLVTVSDAQAAKAVKVRRLRERLEGISEARRRAVEQAEPRDGGTLVGGGSNSFGSKKRAQIAAKGLGLKPKDYDLVNFSRGKWGFRVKDEPAARLGIEGIRRSDVGQDHGISIRDSSAVTVAPEPSTAPRVPDEAERLLDAAVEKVPEGRRQAWDGESRDAKGKPILEPLDDVLSKLDDERASIESVLSCARGGK